MISLSDYQYLHQSSDFKHLPKSLFDQMMAGAKWYRVAKGHTLFFEGDQRDQLFFICQGYAKLEQTNYSGNLFYTRFVGQGQLFPLSGLFLDEHYHFSCQAVTDLEYVCLSRQLYEGFALSHVIQMQHLCQRLSQLLYQHELRLRNMVASSAGMRVTHLLGFLLQDIGDSQHCLPFAISTTELAQMSGTTRETVSHTLKLLKERGVLVQEGRRLRFIQPDYFQGLAH